MAEEDDENLEKYGLELSYNDWLTSDQVCVLFKVDRLIGSIFESKF